MRTHQGTAGARVLAFGGYQPARIVTNDDLAATVETSDEWIRSRVGIASRRFFQEACPDPGPAGHRAV
jgi:3-oxoacyl-[acyl-carrier-protein] synthase-3